MKYKSIWRAIRRGHLKWIADSISGQYGIYRVLRGGRLEYYGISMSAPTSYSNVPTSSSVASEGVETENGKHISLFELLKRLVLRIIKALKKK